jgi:hypothetical protein
VLFWTAVCRRRIRRQGGFCRKPVDRFFGRAPAVAAGRSGGQGSLLAIAADHGRIGCGHFSDSKIRPAEGEIPLAAQTEGIYGNSYRRGILDFDIRIWRVAAVAWRLCWGGLW